MLRSKLTSCFEQIILQICVDAQKNRLKRVFPKFQGKQIRALLMIVLSSGLYGLAGRRFLKIAWRIEYERFAVVLPQQNARQNRLVQAAIESVEAVALQHL